MVSSAGPQSWSEQGEFNQWLARGSPALEMPRSYVAYSENSELEALDSMH